MRSVLLVARLQVFVKYFFIDCHDFSSSDQRLNVAVPFLKMFFDRESPCKKFNPFDPQEFTLENGASPGENYGNDK